MPVATAELKKELLGMMEKIGTTEAVKRFGVSKESLARVAAGLDVRAGTIALVERGLEKK